MATNFNLRLDDRLKAQSFDIIEGYGMTPSQFMRLVLKQVVDTGSLPLTFERRERRERVPTDKLLRAIAEVERGELVTYGDGSLDDFLKAFDDAKN